MLKTAVIFIILLCGGLVILSPAQAQPKQYQYPPRPIEASPGEEFIIILTANWTTGFSWQLAQPVNESIVTVLRTEYKPSEPVLDGSGGKEFWTFRAKAAGTTTISFKYARPWEKGKAPADAVQFMVTVK